MGDFFVCIAFKYNDAFYAVLTDEYKTSNKKILIDFAGCKGHIADKFDYVFSVKYQRSVLQIFLVLYKINTRFRSIGDSKIYLSSSNYHLLINRLMASAVFPKASLVMVEDGLMSYVFDRVTMTYGLMGRIPNFFQELFSISEEKIKTRVISSYYLQPEFSKIDFDNKPIRFDNQFEKSCLINVVNGKKLFAGQPIYQQKDSKIDLQEYQAIIKKMYSDDLIDIYVDHHDDSELLDLGIVPRVNVNKYGYTLEMLIPFVEKADLITFYSSLAYTLVVLNKNIKVFCVNHPKVKVSDAYFRTLLKLNKEITVVYL